MRMNFPLLWLALAMLVSTPAAAAPDAPLIEVTRVYADDEGKTRFGEGALALAVTDYAPPAPSIAVSPRLPVTDLAIARLPVGWYGDWHPAPRRQYALMLSGAFEIETGDGEKRTFAAGSIFLLEDVAGQGHRTRVVGDEEVTVALVPTP
ncbi:MAG: cupin domain-containing protein [Gammaproteobacteria bacterium]